MATSRLCWALLLLAAGYAESREASTPAECQAAASQPTIAEKVARAARDPDDIRVEIALAEAWSDAGCFNDAVNVLEGAAKSHPGNAELQTRLRVAKSVVGEEHFFADLDRADLQAKLKRDVFRCQTLNDVDACNEAAQLNSDDPALLVSLGDALMRAKRPADALQRYRRALAMSGDSSATAEKIRAAEAELPKGAPVVAAAALPTRRLAQAPSPKLAPRRYSNASPDGQSH